MNAIVTSMIANLHAKPNVKSELVDEILYGMPVRILEDVDENWIYVRTDYRYEGYCQKAHVLVDEKTTNMWVKDATYIVSQSFADVLQQPKIQSTKILTLVKGSIIRINDENELNPGWKSVKLATGEIGYVRTKWISEKVADNHLPEQQFRDNVVQTAQSYLGSPYRWGGKTPVGIDCSGLCSMAYMLNGVLIYRDAKIVDGFPIKEISFEQIQKGDLLYFPGHIALYMGNGLYIHSSIDGNEVTINSLNEHHPLYRKDLAGTITAVGSLYQ